MKLLFFSIIAYFITFSFLIEFHIDFYNCIKLKTTSYRGTLFSKQSGLRATFSRKSNL